MWGINLDVRDAEMHKGPGLGDGKEGLKERPPCARR